MAALKKCTKKNKIRVGFRVDADNIVGTGHLMEIIAIIASLRKRVNLDILIVTHKKSFALKKLGSLGVHNIIFIPNGLNEREEAKKTIDILRNAGYEDLVVDLLGRSNFFYAYLYKHLKNLFVILDNHEHKRIPATAVLNFSITQDKKFYQRLPIHHFIGPSFALLNESVNNRKTIVVRQSVRRILVNQGGADPFGLTAKIIKSLASLRLTQKIDIIVGGVVSRRHLNELNKIGVELHGNYRIYRDINQEQVYEIMQKTDLAITAPGNMLYELAYFGIPSLLISHHERHNQVAEAFAQRKAAINFGIGDRIDEQAIAFQVNSIINNKSKREFLSKNIKKLVDGKGTNRFVNILVSLLKKD